MMGGLLFAFLNKLIEALGTILGAIFSLLPDSPFTWDVSSLDSEVLKVFLWIVPVESIFFSLEVFVSAVLIYYAYRVVLRWIKVAGD